MLRLNAERLSEAEVRQAVLTQCSRFGTVVEVSVVAPPVRDYTVATVRMSNAEETSRLLETIGDAKVGEAVFIWIE